MREWQIPLSIVIDSHREASLLVPRCFDRGKGAVVITLQMEYMTSKVKGSHLSCFATAELRLWTIFTENLPENRAQECLCFHRRWAQPLSKDKGLFCWSYVVNLPEMFSYWAASWFYFKRGKTYDGKTTGYFKLRVGLFLLRQHGVLRTE